MDILDNSTKIKIVENMEKSSSFFYLNLRIVMVRFTIPRKLKHHFNLNLQENKIETSILDSSFFLSYWVSYVSFFNHKSCSLKAVEDEQVDDIIFKDIVDFYL